MSTHMYTPTHVRMYTQRTSAHTHVHLHIHAYIYAHLHAHTYTCLLILCILFHEVTQYPHLLLGSKVGERRWGITEAGKGRLAKVGGEA